MLARQNIPVFMKTITAISAVITAISVLVYQRFNIAAFETIAITFCTIFYHCFMRLMVGLFYQKKYNNKINYNKKRFYVGEREVTLYRRLQVKRWKKHLPTYRSEFFDPQTKTYEQIIMATCQSELVHETIVILSFLPIIASVWFGATEIFIITSVVAAIIDTLFVILQRYNRPRILRLLNHTK